jgi:PBP1b-binding outer membrane lipoprotein LpoB
MRRMRFASALIATALLLAGCSSTTSYRAPGKNLTDYKKVWVEKNLSDDHNVHGMITAELKALGYDVDSG